MSPPCRGVSEATSPFVSSLTFKSVSFCNRGPGETRVSRQNRLWEALNQLLLNLSNRNPLGRETFRLLVIFGCPSPRVPYTPASVSPPPGGEQSLMLVGSLARISLCRGQSSHQFPRLGLSAISPSPRRSPGSPQKDRGHLEGGGPCGTSPSMCCFSGKPEHLTDVSIKRISSTGR